MLTQDINRQRESD